jgi:hypothetical protein
MSDWRAWAVPLLAGLVTAGGLWMVAPGESAHHAPDSDHGLTVPAATTSPAPAVLLPFPGAHAFANQPTTFLVLAPRGAAAALAEVNRSTGPLGEFSWQSDRVALYRVAGAPYPCCAEHPDAGEGPLPLVTVLDPEGPGPRLLQDGYNATRVTAFVFDEAGLLLASNAPGVDLLRYPLHGDFIRLPTVAWYLGGNGTAPNGTVALPGFAKPLLDRVLPQLDGLPEGGVATARSNAYVSLFGTLFVTVRIDALVLAP